MTYDEHRCKLARQAADTSFAHFGFLSGAFMSPAALDFATDAAMQSPFCHAEHGDTVHMLWQCQASRASEGTTDVTVRPARPRDALQSEQTCMACGSMRAC